MVDENLMKYVNYFVVSMELDVGGDGHRPVWVALTWVKMKRVAKAEKRRWRLKVERLADKEASGR
jgi:hypothetical protein